MLSPDVRTAFSSDNSLAVRIAVQILDRHFEESLHQNILNAVGLELDTMSIRKKLDPDSRQRLLKAYELKYEFCWSIPARNRT